MLKSCMGNYWNCLKHTFTVLGILFLGIMLGLSAFFRMSSDAVTTMTTDIKSTYQEADLSPGYITDAVSDRLQNIDEDDIQAVIEAGDITPLLEGEINDALNQVAGNYKDFASKTAAAVEQCALMIGVAFGVLSAFILLSQIIGFFATEIGCRESLNKTNFFKVLLEMLVRFLGYALVFFIVYELCKYFPDYRKIFLYLSPIPFVFIGLVCAWLTSRSKEITFKNVVTLKNMALLLIADVLMLAISALIVYALYYIINPVVASVIALELVVVVLVALDLSASSCLNPIRAQELAEPAPAEQLEEK